MAYGEVVKTAAKTLSNFAKFENQGGFTLLVPSLADVQHFDETGNILRVRSFDGYEEMSELFRIELDLVSRKDDIPFEKILDQSATLIIEDRTGGLRYISGVIAEFEQGDSGHHFTHYRAVLMPELHRLRYRSDCRIFQNQTVVQIMETVLKEAGITDFSIEDHKPHAVREYCVQYRETDLEFIERLAAEEGFHYYFMHEKGMSKLRFSDFPGTNPLVQGDGNIAKREEDPDAISCMSDAEYERWLTTGIHVFPYNSNAGGYREESYIRSFTWKQRIRPQHTHHQDYTFKQSAQVQHSQHGSYNSRYKIYDYPGRFKDWDTAKQFTVYQQESHVRDEAVGYAETDIIFPAAGHVFDLADHRNPAFNQRYLIISVHHQGRQPSVLEEEAGLVHVEDLGNDHGLITSYHNQMEFCIKERVFWRPKRRVRPVVDGPQIAKIVGPEGEEIYTDEYGRVKVQFPWDRYGKSNEHSSCWIRVSQNWAGMGWGHIAIPRIDQEVIVEFLEGDPDQPIVTGRTYHDVNRVPYNLADHKTRMTIKSKTHKGDGFNELRFEDEKDREEVFIHAEKDMNVQITNDSSELIGNHKFSRIEGYQESIIFGNSFEQVFSNKSTMVTGSVCLSVGSTFQRTKILPSHTTYEAVKELNSSDIAKWAQQLPLTSSDLIFMVRDNIHVSAGGDSTEDIKGGKIISTGGEIMLTSDTLIKLTSGDQFHVGSTKAIHLISGKSRISMYNDGNIEIKGENILINTNSSAKIKSGKIDLN